MPTPVRLDLIEDLTEPPVGLCVDPIEILGKPSCPCGGDVDRLPVVARARIESVPKSLKHSFSEAERHTRSFTLFRRRIDTKEVLNSRHRRTQIVAPPERRRAHASFRHAGATEACLAGIN